MRNAHSLWIRWLILLFEEIQELFPAVLSLTIFSKELSLR